MTDFLGLDAKQLRAFRFAAIVAFGGFIFGLDAAVISGTVKFISAEFQLSDLEIGTVVSAPGFGVLFALLIAGYLANHVGRKKTLQLISSIYLLSALASAFAPSFITLVAARFLGGLAFTSLSLASMYIGEIAPSNMRGKLVAMNQINIVIGLSAAYFINYLILKISNSDALWATSFGFDQYTWRWMLASEILPAFVWLCLLLSIPESPRWLVLKGRLKEAEEVMEKILPEKEIQKEIINIQKSVKNTDQELSTLDQVKQLFHPSMRVAFWIGLIIAIVQQVTGINAIMFYAPTVFEQVGIGTDAAFVQAIYVGLTSIIFTVLALVLIDKVGRRPLVIWGLLWAVLSLSICAYGFGKADYQLNESSLSTLSENIDKEKLKAVVGITYSNDVEFKQAVILAIGEIDARKYESELIQAAGNINAMLILFGILSFISAFQFSVGPIMWVLFSEIFPIKIRGIAIPFFALITSIVSYLIQQFFPWQLSVMGASGVFLFYAGLTLIGLIALYKFLPETKNKSIEEIEAALAA